MKKIQLVEMISKIRELAPNNKNLVDGCELLVLNEELKMSLILKMINNNQCVVKSTCEGSASEYYMGNEFSDIDRKSIYWGKVYAVSNLTIHELCDIGDTRFNVIGGDINIESVLAALENDTISNDKDFSYSINSFGQIVKTNIGSGSKTFSKALWKFGTPFIDQNELIHKMIYTALFTNE